MAKDMVSSAWNLLFPAFLLKAFFQKDTDMKTIIRKITYDGQMNREIIQAAARLIQEGSLVAFPTETVYGLGADALNPQASRKIYEAKGRPSDNPLIVHISNMADLEKIALHIPPKARKMAEKFWPGPLTMIFEKSQAVPVETTGGLQTVAVRMPDHPVALSLIQAAGGFIAAPSANTSGRPSPTLAEHVAEDLDGRIPMILDGGPVGIGIESTIVDFSEDTPMVLRPGYITPSMIEEVIGTVEMDPALLQEPSALQEGHSVPGSESMQAGREAGKCRLGREGSQDPGQGGLRPKAPGMKYRHYAPKAELILVEGSQGKVQEKINSLVKEGIAAGKRIGIIGTDETKDLYPSGIVKSIGTRAEEDTIAQHLYGILREFDQLEVDRIYSESFFSPGLGQAVMNRMLKAAGHHVIEV